MTNLVLFLSFPIFMQVHTNDWKDFGFGVMYQPVASTNYHQESIIETNYFVVIPATNAVGVKFSYEINLGQTTWTNRRDSSTPAISNGFALPSLRGSVAIHRIEMPPLPR